MADPAKFEVQGLEDKQVQQNVMMHLQTLDAPSNEFQFEDFQTQIEKKTRLALQVYGYYQANIIATRKDPAGQLWQLTIQPGPVTYVNELTLQLQGDGSEDEALKKLLAELPLIKGMRLNHAYYELSKSRIQSLALARGYFDFQFSQHQIKVDQDSNSAKIVLIVDTGQRYRFGQIRLPAEERTLALVNQVMPFKQGDHYQASKLADLSLALKQTQYFRHVLVRPLVSDAVDSEVPIEITLVHKPRDNFDLGGGISSDDVGLRFKAKWERPWVNQYGHSMGAEIFTSSIEQHLTVDYKIPVEDPVKNFVNFQAGFQALKDNDTDSRKMTLAVQRHREVGEFEWQRIDFLRYEHEEYRQGSEPLQSSNLFIPGVTYSRLRSRGGLDMDWGDKQMITVEVAGKDAGSDVNMLRVSALSRWLRSVGEHRFLFRAEGGAIATDEFSDIPSSLRYFAGGDQSVRGFGYRNLAPLDENGELIGARYLAVASAEYSYPVADEWRAAVFFDVGNAFDDFNEKFATGVGVGGIWLSPVGPIRIYVARGQSDTEQTWRLHLLMGPSL
ncbi:autotransporter assembly complex protein TamA [Neptunicella sp. SCSIO 80796]|uniref:autotransporter assembly complex protein TamA n=1 Tax=Neptunicella plasticusilytica TaxID=3117012 RepID=UPI003A4DF189